MQPNVLMLARDNAQFSLQQVAAGKPTSPEEVAARYFSLSMWNRQLAICHLLIDADQEAFAGCLAESGKARLAFLRLAVDGHGYPPIYLCTSKDMAFADALVAGDLVTARAIAALASKQHAKDLEYEDDFLFYHFMHHVVLDRADTSRLNAITERWNAVLEGADSGYRDACVGLLDSTGKAFEPGLRALIAHRRQQMADYRKSIGCDRSLHATESAVSIECLAIIRIAELAGIPTKKDHPLAPSLARVPLRKK